LLLFAELHHALEDVPVLWKEEILAAEALDRGVERVVIEQNGAEDAALSFEIVRERSFDCRVGRHSNSLYFRLRKFFAQAAIFSRSLRFSFGFVNARSHEKIVDRARVCARCAQTSTVLPCGLFRKSG
jgi:hypothetical protein